MARNPANFYIMNVTATEYTRRLKRLLAKAGGRMNDCELNFSRSWQKCNNFSMVMRRRIDQWMKKYDVAGYDEHEFVPFSPDKQTQGGYCITCRYEDDSREVVIEDMTKRDCEVVAAYLNENGADILPFLLDE